MAARSPSDAAGRARSSGPDSRGAALRARGSSLLLARLFVRAAVRARWRLLLARLFVFVRATAPTAGGAVRVHAPRSALGSLCHDRDRPMSSVGSSRSSTIDGQPARSTAKRWAQSTTAIRRHARPWRGTGDPHVALRAAGRGSSLRGCALYATPLRNRARLWPQARAALRHMNPDGHGTAFALCLEQHHPQGGGS